MSVRKATLRLSDDIWDWVEEHRGDRTSTFFLTAIISSFSDGSASLDDADKVAKLIEDVIKLKKVRISLIEKDEASKFELAEQKKLIIDLKHELDEVMSNKSSQSAQFLEINNELLEKQNNEAGLLENIEELSSKNEELSVTCDERAGRLTLAETSVIELTAKVKETNVMLESCKSDTLAAVTSRREAEEKCDALQLLNDKLNSEVSSLSSSVDGLSLDIDRLKDDSDKKDSKHNDDSEEIASHLSTINELSIQVSSLKKEIKIIHDENVQLELDSHDGEQRLKENQDLQERLELITDRHRTLKEGFSKMKASRDLVKEKSKQALIDNESSLSKSKKIQGLVWLTAIVFAGFSLFQYFG